MNMFPLSVCVMWQFFFSHQEFAKSDNFLRAYYAYGGCVTLPNLTLWMMTKSFQSLSLTHTLKIVDTLVQPKMTEHFVIL